MAYTASAVFRYTGEQRSDLHNALSAKRQLAYKSTARPSRDLENYVSTTSTVCGVDVMKYWFKKKLFVFVR